MGQQKSVITSVTLRSAVGGILENERQWEETSCQIGNMGQNFMYRCQCGKRPAIPTFISLVSHSERGAKMGC